MTVSPASAELSALGDTARFTAEVLDQNGQVMAGTTVTWTSSDRSVAAVDAFGLVTAAANGTATVTATSGSASGTAAVTVAQEVNAVMVEPATDTLVAFGDTVRLVAQAADANGHAVEDAEFAWESGDPSVAGVDAFGLVTAAANGTATVTATSGSASGTAAVTVAQEVNAVMVEPATDTLVAFGDTVRLVAQAADANGHAVEDAEFAWESGDPSVAGVDAFGLVTAAANGTATVTATSGSASGTAAVTVAQEVNAVMVEPATDTLVAFGDTVRLVAQAADANGHAVEDAEFAWESGDPSVAGVDAFGLVTAAANGTATVTATSGSASGTAAVTVAQEVNAVMVEPATDTLVMGDTLRLTAYAVDANGYAVEGAGFSWASEDPSVAAVDATGLVMGVAEGRAMIAAAAGSARGTAQITVHSADRAVLVTFFESTSGDFYWDINTNWLSDRPLGTWYGVTTDEDGRVVELTLPNNGVWGPIPREFVQLQKLRRLDLSNNSVNGELPPEIGSLPDLEVLNLSENGFLGSGTPIPAAVGELDKLQVLDLSGTSFQGEIPRELGSLKNLVRLELADMIWLAGSIPPEFGQLVNLAYLNVSGSGLEDALPREIMNTPLELFHWHRTSLCAPGDEEFRTWLRGIASHRAGVRGACDRVGGVICDSWDGWTLASLYWSTDGEYWDNDANWLTAEPLNSWYGVATGDNGRVVELSLPNNGLSNGVGRIVCLEKLKRLDLSANRLEGALGPRIGDLLDLEYLDLSDNASLGYLGYTVFVGFSYVPIPAELGNLRKLQWLDLSGTAFDEEIPRALGNLESLVRLDLADMNWVSGSIPPTFGQLSRLRHLDVSGIGRLAGRLPQELAEVPLALFHWNDTRLCSPPNEEFETWLSGIADHLGGVACGSASGALRLDALEDGSETEEGVDVDEDRAEANPGGGTS